MANYLALDIPTEWRIDESLIAEVSPFDAFSVLTESDNSTGNLSCSARPNCLVLKSRANLVSAIIQPSPLVLPCTTSEHTYASV